MSSSASRIFREFAIMAEETRPYTERGISIHGIGAAAGEKGSMTVVEAGRKGGEMTSRTHGHEFYQEIGHRGGKKGGRTVKELIEEGKRAQARRAEIAPNPEGQSFSQRES